MTKATAALALLALAACVPQPNNAPTGGGKTTTADAYPIDLPGGEWRVTKSADRYKGTLIHIWTFGARPLPGDRYAILYPGGDLRFMVLFTRGVRDPNIGMMFNADSENGWRYLRSHDVAVLVDGVPVVPGKVDHDGNVGRTIREYVTAEFDPAAQAILSTGRKIEIRIGGLETVIDGDAARSLRNFLSEHAVVEPELDAGAAPEMDAGPADGSPE